MYASAVRKSLLAVLGVTSVLLLIPTVAMRFTPEVRWGPGDFVTAGCLLLITGVAMVFAAVAAKRRAHRVALICGIAMAFLAIWAELAVGLFN